MGYIVTGIKKVNDSKSFSNPVATVFTTHAASAENCFASVGWAENYKFKKAREEDISSFTLTLVEVSDEDGSTSFLNGIYTYDLRYELTDSESFCSSHTTVTAVSGGGLVNGETRQCVWGNSMTF